MEKYVEDGHVYLAGLVTDRDYRRSPLWRSENLPLTKEVANELNLALADFLKTNKFNGGVYLSQYLDQLKFRPGSRSYVFNVDGEGGPASFRIRPERWDSELKFSIDADTPHILMDHGRISRHKKTHPYLLLEGH